MQQPITRRDVHEPSLTATLGGRTVALQSASIDRALPDPVQRDRMRGAKGTLVTVEGPDVADTVATPWDPGSQWPPVPESPATVAMDTGAGDVSLLTNGRVVSARGGTSQRQIPVVVADQYQSLDRTISWDAVPAAIPSIQERGTSRYVSMLTTSIVDMILRECGWYATPPRIGFTSLSVPAMGTMWPESGLVTACGRESDVNYGGFPAWPTTTWGMGVDDCRADYSLAGSYSVKSRGRVEMCAVTQNSTGTSSIAVSNNAGSGLYRLLWTASTAYIQARDNSGAFQNVVSVPRVNGLLYATIEYVSDTTVLGTIRCGGASNAATMTGTSTWATTHAATSARLIVQGAAAGFQVAFPSSAGTLTNWAPNAVQYVRTSQRNNLMIRPSVEGENCASFLASICEAEAATYWIDETGVLRWWDLTRLEATAVVATLTSDKDISDAGFEWDHSQSSLRSRVAVNWREPLRTWSWTTSVDLWEGSGGTVQSGSEPEEYWVNVPDDEVWVMVDTAIRRAPGDGSLLDFNSGWGSWYGARGDRGDGVDTWAQLTGSGSFLMTMQRVTDRAFRMWMQWTGSIPLAQKAVGAEAGGSLWSARYDMDLPVIRGKARYQFTDRLTYSAQSGPSSSPERGIDAGWLIQYADQAAYTANYYGTRVTVPQPVLSSIGLTPIPGLQLGDMVEVQETHRSRLTIRGLVVADSKQVAAGMDITHAVAVRPLYVTRNGVKWQEWGRAVGGDQYQEWGARQSGKTYQQWGANPLLGEDVV